MSKILISISAKADTLADLQANRTKLLAELEQLDAKIAMHRANADTASLPKRGYYKLIENAPVLDGKSKTNTLFFYVSSAEGKSIKGYDQDKKEKTFSLNSWKRLKKVTPITKEEFQSKAEKPFELPKLVISKTAATHNKDFKFGVSVGEFDPKRPKHTLLQAWELLNRKGKRLFAYNVSTKEMVLLGRVGESSTAKFVWKSQAIRKAFTGA